jgi:hypothetical protein
VGSSPAGRAIPGSCVTQHGNSRRRTPDLVPESESERSTLTNERWPAIPVYIEAGAKRAFAGAIDWPGWCRSGRGEEDALRALAACGVRYAAALGTAAAGFSTPAGTDAFDVVERLAGNSGTDFGAPTQAPSADNLPLEEAALERQRMILSACWSAFARAVAAADGIELRRGPRGGGRDLGRIVAHVVEADEAYLVKLGARAPRFASAPLAPAAEDILRLHEAALGALASRARGLSVAEPSRTRSPWSARYYVRRAAWHALDHAWEIEDRATVEGPGQVLEAEADRVRKPADRPRRRRSPSG